MRRRLAAATVLVLALTGTAACGSDSKSGSGDTGSADSIDGLTVTGAFGEEPTIKVDDVDVDKVESAVPVEGDGKELTKDDAALYRFVIAKAATGESVASNYQENTPQQLVMSEETKVVTDAVMGKTIGSRVVLAMPVEELLGKEAAPQVGLEPGDDLVMVVDLVDEAELPLTGPEGEPKEAPAWAPKVVEKDGAVTGLDFTGLRTEQPEKFHVVPLIEGEGPKVSADSSVTIDYLGVVWGQGDEPFDESYSGDPATFELTGLIKGWQQGLEGVPVGSRVMLVIPAELGYGKEGSPPSIPGNATLVFVIDVLGATG